MSLDPSFAPQNETANDIFLERTFLQAGYLTALGYGVQLVLYLACMRALLRRESTFLRKFMCAYLTLLCALNTIWTGTSAYGLQATFIDNRNYPGGPFGFLAIEFSLPFNIVSNASYIASNILADALLVWRCIIIWSVSNRGSILMSVMAFPVLLLLASTAIAIVYAIETASPSGLYGESTYVFALPYFTLSLSLNIILTLLIAGRIWAHKRSISGLLQREIVARYTSVTTIFIESAALYAISSILLLTTFAVGNPINQIWLGITPSIQLISSYFIMYRIAEGTAWSTAVLSTIQSSPSNVLRTPHINTSTYQVTEHSQATDRDVMNIPLQKVRKSSSSLWMAKTKVTETGQNAKYGESVGEGDNEVHSV